jgi:hypothetical protein
MRVSASSRLAELADRRVGATPHLHPYNPGSVPLAMGTPTMLPHSVQEPS